MRQPTSSRGQLRVEPLEGRWVPAGNVTATVDHGDLVVTGDAESNNVEIIQTAEGIQVIGDFGTTVNGGASFTAVGVTKDVVVSLGDGDDTLGMALNVPRDLTIVLGAGGNVVNFGGFLDAPVVPVTNGVVVGRDLVISAGSGANTLLIFESQVGRKTEINLGDGGNFMLVFHTTFGGKTEVTSGAGMDSFEIDSSTFVGKTEINTGAGDDTLTLTGCTFQSKTELNGGDGFDALTNDGNTFAVTPQVQGFEA
jgi:hypothetical protein